MSSSSQILAQAIKDAHSTIDSLSALQEPVAHAIDLIADCLTKGGKLLVCGNGGSAADAADFTTEFACRFDRDRAPFPALNLAQGASLLTATANDYGFEESFARQVIAFGKPNDVLVAISTSGNSENIRRALEEGKARQLKTIALLGRDGGKCKGVAETELIVRGQSTARIQEAHKFLLHVICEAVEPRLSTSPTN